MRTNFITVHCRRALFERLGWAVTQHVAFILYIQGASPKRQQIHTTSKVWMCKEQPGNDLTKLLNGKFVKFAGTKFRMRLIKFAVST
jgi:hypothetical protein